MVNKSRFSFLQPPPLPFSISIVVRPVVVVLVATVDLSSTWSNFCGDVAVSYGGEGGGTSSVAAQLAMFGIGIWPVHSGLKSQEFSRKLYILGNIEDVIKKMYQIQVSKSIHEDNFFSSFSPLCMQDETPVNKTTLNFCHYFSLSLYTKKNNRGKKKKVKRTRSRLLFSFFFLGNSFLYLSSLWKSSFDDQELGILQYLNTVNICYVQMKAQITYKHRMSIAFLNE